MSEGLIVNKGIVLLIREDDMVAQGHPYRLCSLSESCLGLKVNDSQLNLILEILSFKNKRAMSFNRLKNVIVATGSPISVPTTIDYADYADGLARRMCTQRWLKASLDIGRSVPFLFWQSGKIVNLALILMLFEK